MRTTASTFQNGKSKFPEFAADRFAFLPEYTGKPTRFKNYIDMACFKKRRMTKFRFMDQDLHVMRRASSSSYFPHSNRRLSPTRF